VINRETITWVEAPSGTKLSHTTQAQRVISITKYGGGKFDLSGADLKAAVRFARGVGVIEDEAV
jgi:hypothetical protein